MRSPPLPLFLASPLSQELLSTLPLLLPPPRLVLLSSLRLLPLPRSQS